MKIILLLGVVAALLAWNQYRPSPESALEELPQKGLSFGELERIKNDSARKMQMQKERSQLENSVSAPPVDAEGELSDEVPLVVDVRKNSAALERDSQVRPGKLSLDAQLNEFMAEREQFEQMQVERKEHYAQEFIQKARRMGYEVSMDKDFQIVGIRKRRAGGSH